MIDLRQTLYAS